MNIQYKKIRILLIEKGISGADIARDLNVDVSAVWHTIHGRTKSLRIRAGISRALGVKITDLWPDETRHLKIEKKASRQKAK